jgi:hypothetical protein
MGGSQSGWIAQTDGAGLKRDEWPRAEREITLPTQSNEDARTRAEANFRKEERAKEGAKAMMEYQANERMVREKTERLRALRLAKEAADKKRSR